MPKFRKKPVVIEAVQFLGENITEIEVWSGQRVPDSSMGFPACLVIHTLEGDMTARPGDWIIRGVNGEFYPCKPDIFEATYEAV